MTTHRYRRMAGWLLCALTLLLALALRANAEVRQPTGEYTETVEDLKVKVVGGYVTVARSWTNGRWYANPTWADLKLTYDSLDGSVKGIERAGTLYERVSAGVFVFRVDQPFTIQTTASGFRWTDTKGNWITYDANGHLTAYGDRNNVQVSFTLDGSGRRTQALDHFGQGVLTFQYTGEQLTGITDRSGRQVRYQYIGNNLTQVTDVLGNTWLYGYDSNGQITSRTDPNGHTTTIVYAQSTPANTGSATAQRLTAQDSAAASTAVASTGATPREYKIARVFTVTDPEHNTTTYLYDYDRVALTYTVTQKFPGGRQVVSFYDKLGRLKQQTTGSRVTYAMTRDGTRTEMVADERGLVTQTVFDGNWNPIKVTYPDGTSVSATYDSVYSNPLVKTDEAGTQTTYQYDAHGNLIQMSEGQGLPEQRVVTYTYDQYGQRLTLTRKGATTADDATTSYTYDTYGNVQTMADAVGNASAYTFDVIGNVLTQRDPRGNTWTRTYNAMGWLNIQTDPLGHGDSITYDKVGNRTKLTDAVGNSTTSAYIGNNWLISVTDALGGAMQYQYDGEGRKTKDADANGITTTYAYDSDGRLSSVTDGNGNITRTVYGDNSNALNGLVAATVYPTYTEQYKYDARNRVTQSIQVLDQATSYTRTKGYDGKGNPISQTDPLGRTTVSQYDALNRLTQTTDPAGGVMAYGYDVRDSLTRVTDAIGNATRYAYDKANRTISETRPLGEATTYAYDGNGNLTARTNAKGEQRRFTYDAANRVTQEQQFAVTGGVPNTTPSRSISFTYDARNLLGGYDDGTSSATYGYDAKGQKTQETVNYGAFGKTIQNTYQANGRKASFTYPDNTQIQYTYDANNQLRTIATPQGTITYASYQWSAATQITVPGVVKTMTYDPLLRPTEIKSQGIGGGNAGNPQGAVVMDYRYAYDAASNIVQRQTQDGSYVYQYDNLDRLTDATPPAALQASVGNPNGLPVEGYSYDPVHNRTASQHQPGPWTYNGDNELLGYGQGAGQTTFQYDANGNTTQRDQGGALQNLGYDVAERLTAITDAANNPVAGYYYDPFGRRLGKTVGSTPTFYQYADEGLIAEFDAGGAVGSFYGWRPDSTYGTSPQFLVNSGGYLFYQNDSLKAPQLLADQSGSVVWKVQSGAFGSPEIESGVGSNPLRFAGQYRDAETGQLYNLSRFYSATTGRYLQRDRIGLAGGVNTYAYANDNPVTWIDPEGFAGGPPIYVSPPWRFAPMPYPNWPTAPPGARLPQVPYRPIAPTIPGVGIPERPNRNKDEDPFRDLPDPSIPDECINILFGCPPRSVRYPGWDCWYDCGKTPLACTIENPSGKCRLLCSPTPFIPPLREDEIRPPPPPGAEIVMIAPVAVV